MARSAKHELPVGRTPLGEVLVMEIGRGFVRFVEKMEGYFEERSLKK